MALELPARLTHADATACLAGLAGQMVQLPAGAPLVVGAQGLQAFDSSALAVLLALHRQAQAAGRGFQLVGAPPRLKGLAGLYGVGAWLAS